MALFQSTVIQKYLNHQDAKKIEEKWEVFKNHFHNPEVQENIRNSKEEQYQGGFFIDLFVNVLGYIKNPEPNFNLNTELKNVKDSKKADGGIIIDNKTVGVIELKGMDTTDLGKIESQAFGYKNNHPACSYVIISNFEKLRFYIDNAVEHIEFNLFNLSEDEFKLLYLCLAYENISKDIPKEIKNKSLSEEDAITNKLYKDYSNFKRELFSSLVNLNPQYDKLLLFKKSQKLLDRFLFIFFAEDKHLLPPNSIRLILDDWEKLKELDAYKPLYDRFKKYFEYLNTGHKGKRYDVFPYNGGLFKLDEVLDQVKIDDQLLYEHTLRLSEYDFDSEVDVNILGHIFENSLNEIEEVQAEIEGETFDKTKTKRKKDGVFYTPKYITKYIVENTVGKLCIEKKEELKLIEEDYTSEKKMQQKTKKALLDKLSIYRDWLLQLTIIDPACGSGAFLNEALDFLIKEHQYLDELETKLTGGGFIFPNIENSILENNLFGVDLNEESVEIAKLSLWLRTAEPHRKLNDLNNNLKCGNSLIDDPEIAGDKAFNWEEQFPKVFEKGGFDVVIGNPPYGAKLDKEAQNYLNNKYIKGGSETAISFIKLSYDLLLKDGGEFGFIIPKSFSFSSNYAAIRDYLLSDITEIIDCKKVWKEVLLEQVMIFFNKSINTKKYISGVLDETDIIHLGDIDKSTFNNFGFYLNGISNKELTIGLKINSIGIFISNVSINSRGGNFQRHIMDSGDLKVLGGAEIQREGIKNIRGFVNTDIIGDDKKALINQNSILAQNIVAHILNPFEHIKITACYPEERDYVILDTINQITFDNEYEAKVFWLMFNAKLINWYVYRFILAKAIRTIHFDSPITNRIPIPKTFNQQPFIDKADLMLSLNKELQEVSSKFQRTLQRKFPEELEKLSKKLESWYELDFGEFVKELKKKKIKLSLSEEADWEDYFLTEQKKAIETQSQINATDREIDQMVYELYGLTKEEIAIVENS